MLIKVKVSNFLSFKDEVEFSLEASSIKEYSDSNTFTEVNSDLSLLNGAVLYGANSAGKSNLIKALSFIKKFVLTSSRDLQATDIIEVEPFKLSTQTVNKPSSFEIEFIASDKRYRYIFEADSKSVKKEYLFEVLKTKEKPLFTREDNHIQLYDEFESKQQLKEITRENALFLSVAAQFNVITAISIIKWFQDLIFIYDINFQSYISYTAKIIDDPKRKKILLRILNFANLEITDLKTEKIEVDDRIFSGFPSELRKAFTRSSFNSTRILTQHIKYDHLGNTVGSVTFDLSKEESLGTQKYFALAGYVMDSLEHGKVILVDELDARLHPLLCTLIIKLYNSRESNPHNAQLIFATHNTNLMSDKILRRDQIVLVKKNKLSGTELNTLHQLKVRNDASFEKEYLDGEYDAVPFNKLPIPFNLFGTSN